jgi:hypothetical protein
MPDPALALLRQTIVEKYLNEVLRCFAQAYLAKKTSPTVLLVDPKLPYGMAIAEALGDGEKARAMMALAESNGADTLLAWGLSREAVLQIVKTVLPWLVDSVGGPTKSGYFMTVVVAADGAAVILVPAAPLG